MPQPAVAPVVQTSPTFQILLQTRRPADPNFDDNALFRIGQGYRDYNGNGQIDFGENAGVVAGYEQFLTLNQPLYNTALPSGTYLQTIDASLLEEGYHYLSVIAFRHRSDGGEPIFTDSARCSTLTRTAGWCSSAVEHRGFRSTWW